LGAAFALGRSMTSMLYEVSATDPVTFAAISVVALALALFASLLPALRVVRLDPIKALRVE
jgi:putative ABC transport system permease protein